MILIDFQPVSENWYELIKDALQFLRGCCVVAVDFVDEKTFFA